MIQKEISDSVKVLEPEDSTCDHEWESKPHRRYEVPNPDPRNPIYEYNCEHCPATRHKASYGRYWELKD